MEKIWIDAVDFENRGGWCLDTQFVRSVGQSYLIANDIPGEPASDASIVFSANENTKYRVFVRTKNWKFPEAPGQFQISVDGTMLSNICGKMPTNNWYWEIAGDIDISKGEHLLSVHDITGWLSRFASIIITNDMDFTPSPEIEVLRKQRANIKNISNEIRDKGEWDLVVVGAGPGGVPAAIAAARKGLRVALITGRPAVGGNASIEGTIGLDGAASRHNGMHETGIANEIKRTREYKKITWQYAMEYLLQKEKNVTVFCNELCIDAKSDGEKIFSAITINAITLIKSEFKGKYFADCSGDAWLGYYAGAQYRIGREAKWQHNEELAPDFADTLTMSGCVCATKENSKTKFRGFLAKKMDTPQKFEAPDWIVKLPEGEKLGRGIPSTGLSSAWWVENSNDFDDLWDDEFARDELVRLALGYFDWLKNSNKEKERFANNKLIGLPLHNSKRENRRLVGDYFLNFNDFDGKTDFDDAVTYCGWSIDLHHPRGMYSGKEGAFYSNNRVPCTPIPFRCLYSKNISNLLMAGRCASVTHIALGSARVESTIATEGQIIGTAAAYCIENSITPREIYLNKMQEFRQLLLRDDITILNLKNNDPTDLAKTSKISVSSTSSTQITSTIAGTYDKWISLEKPVISGPIGSYLQYDTEYYRVELKNDDAKEQNVLAELLVYESEDKLSDAKTVDKTSIETEANNEGWYTLELKKIPSGIKWAIKLSADKKVCWRNRCPTKGMISYTIDKGEYIKQSDGFQLSYSNKVDIPVDCSCYNMINGINRTTIGNSNCWVSDEKLGLPQSAIFELEKESKISMVQLIVDVDLAYPAYAFHYVPLADRTIKSYDVSVFADGDWKVVASVTDNYNRLSRVNFKPIRTKAVKITVKETLGVPYAKIYEVRIY